MGRSVNYLNDANLVLYFNTDWIGTDSETGEWSDFLAELDWNDFKENLIYKLQKIAPSLEEANEWEGNEVRIFLENSLIVVALSEYCGLTSLSFRVKEAEYDDEVGRENLAKAWFRKIKPKFEALAELKKVGRFSNGNCLYEAV